jgi:hypothetical protein
MNQWIVPASTPSLTFNQGAKLTLLSFVFVLAFVANAAAQGANPLRITCPPNQTHWVCDTASTAVISYPTPATTADCPTNAAVTCHPQSGTAFVLGTTLVTCRAINSCRETAECSFTVTLARDTTAPAIQCPANRSVWLCGAGATAAVSWPPPNVTDNTASKVSVTCNPPSGSSFPPGTNLVTCVAKDDCGNAGQCSFEVRVIRDNTPPVITCPTNIHVSSRSNSAVVSYSTSATDVRTADVNVVCSPPSGSVFPPGATTVVCIATDLCTNRSTCAFTVTVSPPLLHDGLYHSPLGQATLNINTNDELEVTGLTATGEDGVRIDLGDSQGLRWQIKFPTSQSGDEVDGRDFVVWRKYLAISPTGNEIQISEDLFAFIDGRLTFTPSAASYEVKLLLRGEVVHRQGGRTGSIDIPECHHVEQEHCVGQPFADLNPQIPSCINFLTVECDWETPSGPVRADALVVTPEEPLPPFTYASAVELRGRNLPLLKLKKERLLMFGSAQQPSRPHRALGQARLVADNGMLTLAGLGSTGKDGVAIDLTLEEEPEHRRTIEGYSAEFHAGNRIENVRRMFYIVDRTRTSGACTDSIRGGLRLSEDSLTSARLEVHCRPCESWLAPYFAVYNAGQPVGGATLTGSGPLATMNALEAELPPPIGAAKLPSHPLGFQMRFDGRALFTLQDGTRLTGDEIRVLADTATPGSSDVATLIDFEWTSEGIESLTITSETPLEALRLACPSNMTVRACSASPAPVSFLAPFVTGGNCSVPPVVVCVPPSGSLFPLGSTTVICTVTNACAERAVCSFTVLNGDITSPGIQCPTNVSVSTANPAGRPVYFGPQIVTDDPAASVHCVPPSGSVFPVGSTPVVCVAQDACGNQQTCSFTVEVALLKLLVGYEPDGWALSWTGDAVLEMADEVSGPWLPIRGASNPFIVAFVGAKKFFRLAAPAGDVDCGEVVLNPSVWNIDVPSARIQGAFLLGGEPFPLSFLHGANFFLRNAAGDEVYLGLSNNQFFDRRIIPGRYDVIYEHKIGRDVPLNTLAVVLKDLVISGDQAFDIDVPAVRISGAFTLQGMPFPLTPIESALIQARDRQTGALAALGETSDQTYAALLIPGAYDLMYSRIAGSDTVPANALTAFRRNLPILESGALNIDVPKITLTGNFRVNGALAPDFATETGWISLLDPDTGAKTLLGQTRFQSYQRILIPGAYDLHYERIAGADILPANASARFQTGVELVADAAFHIDLPVAQISGAFLVNGAPAPMNALEYGRIRLRNAEDTVYLGETSVGQFSLRVLEGTYQLAYEYMTGSDIMPANRNAVFGTVAVNGSAAFDIDIPAVSFDAELQFNGGAFPGPVANESGRLTLEDASTSDLILLGHFPAQDVASRKVIPGTYRVRYEYESGVQLPRNRFAPLGEDLEIAQGLHTVINIRTANLSGTFTLNGGAFPAAPGQNAAMVVRSLTSGDSLVLGGTADGGYSTVIIPGAYAAYYDWALGDLIPRNQQARLDCALP